MSRIRIIITILVFITSAALSATGYYLYTHQPAPSNPSPKPSQITNSISITPNPIDVNSVYQAVRKIIDIPLDEVPVIATVGQSEKLRNNSEFFKNALNDDYILVFMQSKKAILFRPSTGKIVQIAPVIDNQPQTPRIAGAASESASPTITP